MQSSKINQESCACNIWKVLSWLYQELLKPHLSEDQFEGWFVHEIHAAESFAKQEKIKKV